MVGCSGILVPEAGAMPAVFSGCAAALSGPAGCDLRRLRILISKVASDNTATVPTAIRAGFMMVVV